MKKLSGILLVITMVFSLISFLSMSEVKADEIRKDGFIYKTVGSEAYITGYEGASKNLVIPSSVNGKTVTKICEGAFRESSSLKSVVIPKTVLAIEDGDYVFDEVRGYVDNGAFSSCAELTDVVFEKGSLCSYIGKCAFVNCKSLSRVVLPESIKTLEMSAFESCSSLVNIDLPDGLEVIGQNTFTGSGIVSLILPESLESFHSWNSMEYLKSIDVRGNNPYYRSENGILYDNNNGEWDLAYYPWAKSDKIYKVPDFVTELEYTSALLGKLEADGEYIEKPYLEVVDIGMHKVTVPGELVNEIKIDKNNPYYILSDKILYSKDKKTVLQIPRSLKGTVTIPDGVTTIGDRAGLYASFSEIVLPESVVNFNKLAFGYNTSLRSLTVKGKINTLAEDIVTGCTALESIDLYGSMEGQLLYNRCYSLKHFPLPDGLTKIKSDMFGYCYGLESIFIPKSITAIETDGFYAIDFPLKVFYEGSSEQWNKISIDGGNDAVLTGERKYGVTREEYLSWVKNESKGENSTPSAPGDVQFTDVTADTVVPTSFKAINWAVENGIVKGYSDNTFRPEAICTREQFTIMLWRFAGEPASDAGAVNRFTDISDFSNNTSKKAVAWAVEQGIIKGFSDGSFRPKEDITRAQVAVMLWRFAGEERVSGGSKFSDISSYSSSVQNAIIWEEGAGVASGYKDGTFKPDDGCQRQHMAIFLYRFNSKVAQYKPLG